VKKMSASLFKELFYFTVRSGTRSKGNVQHMAIELVSRADAIQATIRRAIGSAKKFVV
jgi:hypothetical protein